VPHLALVYRAEQLLGQSQHDAILTRNCALGRRAAKLGRVDESGRTRCCRATASRGRRMRNCSRLAHSRDLRTLQTGVNATGTAYGGAAGGRGPAASLLQGASHRAGAP
jgi:hypothetical protein